MSATTRLLIVYLAVAALLIAAHFVFEGLVAAAAYIAVSALTVVALVVGVRVMRPSWPSPWYLLIAGQGAFLVGDLVFYALDLAGLPVDGASLADGAYIVGYPFIALGVLLFIRARQPRYTLTAALDAVIVGVAAAAMLWLLVAPAVTHDPSIPLLDRIVLLAYPMGDVVLVSAAAYLLLSGRQRRPAFVLLTASLATLLLADVLYTLTAAAEGVAAEWPDAIWLLSYVLFGMTAMVPSMRQLTESGDAPAAAEGTRRLVLLGAALAMLPASALVQEFAWGHLEYLVILPLSTIAGLAVLLRMHELVAVHRRAEQRYASLLTHASDAFAVVGPDGTLTYASPASESVLGYSPSELHGRSLMGLLDPRDAHSLAELLGEVAAGRLASTEIELRVQRKDGSWRWLSALATDRTGDPVVAGLVLNIRDVTERHEADERLRLQARLLEEVKHAVVVTDPQGRVSYWNAAAEALYGWSADEVIGRPLVELTKPRAGGRTRDITSVLMEGGRWSGELELSRRDGSRLTAMVSDSAIFDEDGEVRAIIGVSFDISERKRLEKRLERQAFRDALTGLANRALFLDRVGNALARAERTGRSRLAVLFLDVDDFKTINDSLGHGAGDDLLVTVARRVQGSLRAGDTAARLGGDEFAVLLDGAGRREAERVAGRILAAIGQPVALGGREVRVSCSMGIAIPVVSGGESAEDLLRNADLAMYAAKNEQRGTYAVYRPEMHAAAVRRLRLKADLESALGTGHLHIEYQPVVRLSDGQPVGAEALLRWSHPDFGPVPAAEAVALAAESGLVLELVQWIMRTAFAQARRWQLGAANTAPLPFVAINATVRELLDADYAGLLAKEIRAASLDSASVTVELTETALMAEHEAAIPALQRVKALGVRLAIDDFGTGYSSLNYLTRLPLDVIKIDRSFIARDGAARDNWAIARSIVELARALNLETIAEGIEHTDEAAALSAMGCNHGQGFLLGRPMSAVELGRLLRVSARAVRAASDARPRSDAVANSSSPDPSVGPRPSDA